MDQRIHMWISDTYYQLIHFLPGRREIFHMAKMQWLKAAKHDTIANSGPVSRRCHMYFSKSRKREPRHISLKSVANASASGQGASGSSTTWGDTHFRLLSSSRYDSSSKR